MNFGFRQFSRRHVQREAVAKEKRLMEAKWGLLDREFLPDSRRTRTLGLGASVRSFNDFAALGLSGMWQVDVR